MHVERICSHVRVRVCLCANLAHTCTQLSGRVYTPIDFRSRSRPPPAAGLLACCLLACWLAHCMAGRLAGCFVQLAGCWLAGWVAGWLATLLLTGWLAGDGIWSGGGNVVSDAPKSINILLLPTCVEFLQL